MLFKTTLDNTLSFQQRHYNMTQPLNSTTMNTKNQFGRDCAFMEKKLDEPKEPEL